jgi:hypothetical protein
MTNLQIIAEWLEGNGATAVAGRKYIHITIVPMTIQEIIYAQSPTTLTLKLTENEACQWIDDRFSYTKTVFLFKQLNPEQ